MVRAGAYDAKIEQIVVSGKDGVFGDVVLGYDTIDGVLGGQASMGAFIGRYANRIGAARSPWTVSPICFTSTGEIGADANAAQRVGAR